MNAYQDLFDELGPEPPLAEIPDVYRALCLHDDTVDTNLRAVAPDLEQAFQPLGEATLRRLSRSGEADLGPNPTRTRSLGLLGLFLPVLIAAAMLFGLLPAEPGHTITLVTGEAMLRSGETTSGAITAGTSIDLTVLSEAGPPPHVTARLVFGDHVWPLELDATQEGHDLHLLGTMPDLPFHHEAAGKVQVLVDSALQLEQDVVWHTTP